ncbi:hypothetical protein RIEGSTA812A_PEG_300 [invertebrate metagenome]|uniref:Uncharacterized protein n=1 Tax=invertebrate metagenome TaxID=1711999 RepID=A0A484H4W3_9ZZZZ
MICGLFSVLVVRRQAQLQQIMPLSSVDIVEDSVHLCALNFGSYGP